MVVINTVHCHWFGRRFRCNLSHLHGHTFLAVRYNIYTDPLFLWSNLLC